MRKDWLKRLALLCFVFLLACSLLSAFPSRTKRLTEADMITVQAEIVSEAVTESDEAVSGLKTAESASSASAALSQQEKKEVVPLEPSDLVALTTEEADEVIALIEDTVEDIEAEHAEIVESDKDIASLTAQIDELSALNAAQADEIARSQGSKAYARLTTSVSFEEGLMTPSLWLGGAVGARIGDGLLLDVGAQYKLGTVNNFSIAPSINNLMFSFSVGWEW